MPKTPTDFERHQCDVLIIGCGASGLSLAAKLPETLKVLILAKADFKESSSYWAQGGISAVIDDKDSVESHIRDTLNAGAGLCSEKVVAAVVKKGADTIEWLKETIGVHFSCEENDMGETLKLAREAGHSHRRIVHSGDATGSAVQTSLLKYVEDRSNVKILRDFTAVDLIAKRQGGKKVCVGIYGLNQNTQTTEVVSSRITVLATGGAGKAYLYTSNPDSASGDGIAMAWRAGCRVANMEFMQFHPTCLYHHDAKSFLLSEALRGEGAKLTLPNGKRFMQTIDPDSELALRDIVARAIDDNVKRYGLNYVLLDISHRSKSFLTKRFPHLYQKCLSYGYDMAKQPIPVVPAAHYTCGGVMADLEARTDIAGLYAIGETAHTGLHGANRIASNSLLECIVFAEFAAHSIAGRIGDFTLADDIPEWDESRVMESAEKVMIAHNWHELRQTMWDYVGIVRTRQRLVRAKQRIAILSAEVDDYHRRFIISNNLLELRNLVCVAKLILDCALARRESRGLHYIRDYPTADSNLTGVNTILMPPNFSDESVEKTVNPLSYASDSRSTR